MASAAELALVLLGKDEGAKALFQSVRGEAAETETAFSKAFKIGGAAAVGALGLVSGAALGVANDMNNATNTIQTQLGVTRDEAKELGDVAVDVFKNNFAGSIQDAATTVTQAFQVMGSVGNEELQGIAENAHRLKDAFGIETTESIDAAKTLMDNFGISSEEAFDLIAAGMQKGLNRSGDFLDTIGEYSTQFASGGASVEQFFGLLESGLQGGMLGTDKAADAFKEFRVRILDGSKTTSAALAGLGIDAEEFTRKLAQGEMTGVEAFAAITQGLVNLDDEGERMRLGVALMGTQFEDLGTQGALALEATGDSFEDVEGAAKSLDAQYNNLGSTIEAYKRKALVALLPVTEAAGDAIPVVGQLGMAMTGLGPIAATVGPAFLKMAGMAVPALRSIGLAMLTPPMGFVVILTAAAVAAYVFRDDIIGAFGAMADWVVPKVEWVGEKVTGAFQAILDFGKENWPEIASILLLPFTGPLIFLATDAFGVRSALIGAFSDVKDYIAGVWPGIADQAAAGWGVIWSVIRANVNLIIDLINGLIRAWNSLEFSMSDPSGVLGFMGLPDSISVGTPDLPLVPRLKTGHPFIPFDNFPALLHRGERVLTAEENATYHQNNSRRSVHFYGPVYFNSGAGNSMQSSELLLMRP